MNPVSFSISPLGPANTKWHAAPGPHLRGILVALILTIAALFLSGQARAQTFACVNAETPTELAICNSEELIVLDERLPAMITRYTLRLSELAGPVPVRRLASLTEYRPQN